MKPERLQLLHMATDRAGGRIVDESHAPSDWTLADRAGNRVRICAWPDDTRQRPGNGDAEARRS